MKKRFISLTLALSMIMSLFVIMPQTAGAAPSEDGGYDSITATWYVKDAQDLLEYINQTKTYAPAFGYTVKLINDIDVSAYDAQIRIGDEDDQKGFHGTFDGQGHKITGLTYIAENSEDTGLFAYTTDKAVIKNLVIEGANIKSALRGGILVGHANGTKIYNVSVRNSKIELFSNGSVITVATNLGMRGGIIAGDLDGGSVMYNCEAVDSDITVGSVGGVQALGGDGIILGGLAGVVSDATVEYSRVIGDSKVDLDYRMAIGALNFKLVYAGGLVGEAKSGANVIDCFSTANVRAQAETYVSVGAGADGCVGGIVGYAPDSGYNIERCHFAGILTSRFVNSILVLPVIVMNDYYLNGILGRNENGSSCVKNCYYDWDKARSELERARAEISAVEDTSDNADFSSLSHSQYTNTVMWTGKNYDFEGTTERSTAADAIFGGEKHYNRWVMDYVTGMPVHGKGVTAATDFPGAGLVTIDGEGYREAVSTDTRNVTQITDTYDETVKLTAADKEGYVFKGWYKGTIDETGVGVTEGECLSTSPVYEPEVTGNEVFVADYQAVVTYMNSDSSGVYRTENYDYNDLLQLISDPPQTEGQTFYGWTLEKGTHTDLNSEQMSKIEFVKNGSAIVGPLTLYPVYAGVGNNIKVVFQETGTTTITDGEGTELLKTNSATDKNGWYIEYTGTVPEGYLFDGWYQIPEDEFEDSKYADSYAINLENRYCVSRTPKYYVDEDYYTDSYYYVAKFKYKVTAWVPKEVHESAQVSYFQYGIGDPYAEIFVNYNESADSVKNRLGIPSVGSADNDGVEFKKWTDNGIEKGKWYSTGYLSGVGTSLGDLLNECSEYTGNILGPAEIYALFDGIIYGNVTFITYTDFPGAADMSWEYKGGNLWNNAEADINVTMKEHYNFVGLWQYCENGDSNYYTYEIPWDGSQATWNIVDEGDKFENYYQEYALLKASANVNFYDSKGVKKEGGTLSHKNPTGWDKMPTVTRKYQSKLFGNFEDEAVLTSFETTPIATRDVPVGIGNTPKNDVMYVPNYKFLGWVDKESFRDSGIDETYLYDYEAPDGEADNAPVSADYITTDSKKADGYILNDNDRVYAYMDIHPVYAMYKVNITTNIGEDSGLDEETKPDPEYTVDQDGNIVVKPDGNNDVTVDKIVIVDENGNEIELVPDGETGNYKPADDTKLDVDEEYEVKIEYKYNVTVTYHVGGTDKTYTETKQNGDKLGETVNTKLPELTNAQGVFVGWTETEPEVDRDYVTYVKNGETATVLVTSETVVNNSMDFYPAYVMISHSSNIDNGGENYTTLAGSKLTADSNVAGYAFGGWSMVTAGEAGDVSELISPEFELTVSKEQALSAKEFVAIYKPVITYKIPTIKGENITYNSKITESVDIGLEIEDGITNTSGAAANAVMEAMQGTTYLNFLGWTTDVNPSETSNLYNGEVTSPITLYPVMSKEAPEGMHRVEFNFYAYDQEEKKWEKQNAVTSVADNYIMTMFDPGDYTDADGNEHLFEHWTYGEDNVSTINSGAEHTVNADVKFTAVYTEKAYSSEYTVYSNWDDTDAAAIKIPMPDNTFPVLGDTIPGGFTPAAEEEGVTFIGYALVTIGADGARYCDGLYAVGDVISRDTLEVYGGEGSGTTKRIYAVWAQIETAKGASIRLDEEGGMRVMGYVNNGILEKVGLDEPDKDYTRSVTFTTGESFDDYNAENTLLFQTIDATSGKWYGQRCWIEPFGDKTEEGLTAFSIIAQLNQYYNMEMAFRAGLTFTYTDGETKSAYGTFNLEENKRAIQQVAKAYYDECQKEYGNATPENDYWGIGETAYNNLVRYMNNGTASEEAAE